MLLVLSPDPMRNLKAAEEVPVTRVDPPTVMEVLLALKVPVALGVAVAVGVGVRVAVCVGVLVAVAVTVDVSVGNTRTDLTVIVTRAISTSSEVSSLTVPVPCQHPINIKVTLLLVAPATSRHSSDTPTTHESFLPSAPP